MRRQHEGNRQQRQQQQQQRHLQPKRSRSRTGIIVNTRCVYYSGLLVISVLTGFYSGYVTDDVSVPHSQINGSGIARQRRKGGRRKQKGVDGRTMARQSLLESDENDRFVPVPYHNAFPPGVSFRPLNFFSSGAGGKYSKEELVRMGINRPELKSMTSLTWMLEKEGNSNPPNFPPNVLFFHLRKAAGTSVENSMVRCASDMINNTSSFYHDGVTSTAKKYFPWRHRRTQEMRQKFNSMSTDVLNRMHAVQKASHDQAKIFTVVRDPVGRFVSSVAQVLGMIKKRHDNDCLKGTARECVFCILNRIIDDGLGFNVHFVPMAVNVKAVIRDVDLSIDVYRMDQLSDMLVQFGVDPETRENANDKVGVLSEINLSVLDTGMIKAICDLYQIDIDMMHSLGFKVPYCDDLLAGSSNDNLGQLSS